MHWPPHIVLSRIPRLKSLPSLKITSMSPHRVPQGSSNDRVGNRGAIHTSALSTRTSCAYNDSVIIRNGLWVSGQVIVGTGIFDCIWEIESTYTYNSSPPRLKRAPTLCLLRSIIHVSRFHINAPLWEWTHLSV